MESTRLYAHWSQKRWFKMISKPRLEVGADDCPFTYTLVWAKKAGGTVLNSLETADIQGFHLLEQPRPLVYNATRQTVMLASQVSDPQAGDPSDTDGFDSCPRSTRRTQSTTSSHTRARGSGSASP